MRIRPENTASERTPSGFERLMIQIGMMVTGSLGAVIGILWRFIGGTFRMLWYILRQIGRFFCVIGRGMKKAFREHNRTAKQMLKKVRQSKEAGGMEFAKQILCFIGNYIFGEYGILRTCFNYVMPVLAVVFLIAIVQYGTGLDYAISVTVNGEELGIISSESEFEDAEKEVQQRVSSVGDDFRMEFHPTYSLRIVSAEEEYVNAQLLADRLLEGADVALVEAYGVYVEGEFIGAAEEVDTIDAEMDTQLAEYAATLDSTVSEVYYTKKIDYQFGVYLMDSLMDPEEILAILTQSEESEGTYVAQQNDSLELIALKYHTTVEDLEERNPLLVRGIRAGSIVKVPTLTRYIPIGYTRNMTIVSYIDYATVRVETSALNLGTEKVIAKGARGEKMSEVLVTYEDGIETGREVLSAVITKEPVAEQVGIGTYSPQPDSEDTIFAGNGKFGWPVNGGYISDPYISDRNHKGLDIAAPYGTEIYAAGSGTVTTAGWNSGGYGNYVVIEHEDGYSTVYGHCSRLIVSADQVVEKGQLIGYVGSTGNSTGNHLHFEVRVNNICTDPGNYLRVNVDE